MTKTRFPRFWVIIAAAGGGTRFGGQKQFAELGGVTALERSVSLFADDPRVAGITVSAPPDEVVRVCALLSGCGLRTRGIVISGGACRADSVARCFDYIATSTNATHVAIHDAARPCTSPQDIAATLDAAVRHGAAALAARVTDTVRGVDDRGFAVSALDRSSLRLMQTPQAFEVSIYAHALEAVRSMGSLEQATDDCMLLELAGCGERVRLVEPTAPNPKITLPEDLEYARMLVNQS